MGNHSKREYLQAIRQRYRAGSKSLKRAILDEFCGVCGYNRKYAIRLLKTECRGSSRCAKRKRGRPPQYADAALLEFLKRLWSASNLACAKRLKAMIPLWLPFYERQFHSPLSNDVKTLLSRISAATIDRLLAPVRSKYTKLGLATTKPGSLLKKHIPINTDQWDQTKPGFLEADTVAHCGSSAAGMFVYTVNIVDIATGWTEQRATWGKGEQGVLQAIKSIEGALPFPIEGFDCDNGTEFLNWPLLKYFTDRKRPVHYTRSREYHKNDNAHVEGKNWTHVRQYLGYDRLENEHSVADLNELYTAEWRLFLNFFLPSVKLIKKERQGSKIIKRHDRPKTPFQRVMESRHVAESTKHRLQQQLATLNPFALQHVLKNRIKRILRYAALEGRTQTYPPHSIQTLSSTSP